MRRLALVLVAVIVAFVVLGSVVPNGERSARAQPRPVAVEGADPSYVDEIEQWHARRIDSLRREDGWLSLVGLFALPEGPHRIGSGPQATLTVPDRHPPLVGTLEVREGEVRITAAEGVELRAGDQVATEFVMRSDAEGQPTVIEVGDLLFYVIERNERKYLRVKDRRAPLLSEFAGIERWPVDARWRMRARWIPYDVPKRVLVPNVLGTVDEVEVSGAVEFELEGRTFRLDPTSEGETLFFVFGDATNGVESYGAGRFLVTDAPDSTGHVFVDFNRAYNPPCVFTPFATCPLPPEGNELDVAIEAGEKMWGAAH